MDEIDEPEADESQDEDERAFREVAAFVLKTIDTIKRGNAMREAGDIGGAVLMSEAAAEFASKALSAFARSLPTDADRYEASATCITNAAVVIYEQARRRYRGPVQGDLFNGGD